MPVDDGPLTRQRLGDAIDRGLEALAARQAADGSFVTLAGPHEDLEVSGVVDPSVFTTATVVTALYAVAGERAGRIVARAAASLVAERLPVGAWRFWAKSHPGASFMPPDVDDTACCARAVRLARAVGPFGEALLLGNRDTRGIYYTWMLPRLRHLAMPAAWPSLAWIMASPLKLRRWLRSGAEPPRWHDIGLVVNANVLALLGDRAETRGASEWIRSVVRAGREVEADRWYQSELAAWYAILHCVEGGVRSLDATIPMILPRLLAACDEPAVAQMRAIDAAHAATLLHACSADRLHRVRVVTRILETQAADGSWPTCPLYYDGFGRRRVWGSGDATTALCVEALARTLAGPPA